MASESSTTTAGGIHGDLPDTRVDPCRTFVPHGPDRGLGRSHDISTATVSIETGTPGDSSEIGVGSSHTKLSLGRDRDLDGSGDPSSVVVDEWTNVVNMLLQASIQFERNVRTQQELCASFCNDLHTVSSKLGKLPLDHVKKIGRAVGTMIKYPAHYSPDITELLGDVSMRIESVVEHRSDEEEGSDANESSSSPGYINCSPSRKRKNDGIEEGDSDLGAESDDNGEIHVSNDEDESNAETARKRQRTDDQADTTTGTSTPDGTPHGKKSDATTVITPDSDLETESEDEDNDRNHTCSKTRSEDGAVLRDNESETHSENKDNNQKDSTSGTESGDEDNTPKGNGPESGSKDENDDQRGVARTLLTLANQSPRPQSKDKIELSEEEIERLDAEWKAYLRKDKVVNMKWRELSEKWKKKCRDKTIIMSLEAKLRQSEKEIREAIKQGVKGEELVTELKKKWGRKGGGAAHTTETMPVDGLRFVPRRNAGIVLPPLEQQPVGGKLLYRHGQMTGTHTDGMKCYFDVMNAALGRCEKVLTERNIRALCTVDYPKLADFNIALRTKGIPIQLKKMTKLYNGKSESMLYQDILSQTKGIFVIEIKVPGGKDGRIGHFLCWNAWTRLMFNNHKRASKRYVEVRDSDFVTPEASRAFFRNVSGCVQLVQVTVLTVGCVQASVTAHL